MRNRIVVTTIAALLSLTVSHAQLIRGFGFKVGAVSSSQDWHSLVYTASTTHRWAFEASAFVELVNIPVFSLVTELQYSQRGALVDGFHSTLGHRITFLPNSIRYDYLSIPIMAKFRLSTSLLETYLLFGPRFDILLSQHQDIILDFTRVSFERAEEGLTAGFGAELRPSLLPGILAEIRYNSSFKDSYNDNYLRIRGHSVDFMLGVRL